MCWAWLKVLPVDCFTQSSKAFTRKGLFHRHFKAHAMNCVFPTPNSYVAALNPNVVVFGMGPLGGN